MKIRTLITMSLALLFSAFSIAQTSEVIKVKTSVTVTNKAHKNVLESFLESVTNTYEPGSKKLNTTNMNFDLSKIKETSYEGTDIRTVSVSGTNSRNEKVTLVTLANCGQYAPNALIITKGARGQTQNVYSTEGNLLVSFTQQTDGSVSQDVSAMFGIFAPCEDDYFGTGGGFIWGSGGCFPQFPPCADSATIWDVLTGF